MRLVVNVKVEAVNRCSDVFVLKRPFRAVAIRQNDESFASNRRLAGKLVDLVIRHIISNIMPQPAIEDSGAVYAKQDPISRRPGFVIDVNKSIYTGLSVVVGLIAYAVNNAGSAGCRCDFAGIENIE